MSSLPSATDIPPTLPEEIFRKSRPRPAPPSLVPPTSGPSRAIARVRAAGLLRRGSLIDKYQIEEVLGVGGFAAVYRATHLLLRMPVAIKLLREEVLARRPGAREQLIDEARFTARINHPNVVRIYDATHSEDLTYIVMEYIDGASLSRRIAHGPVDVSTTLRVALNVVAGLRAGLAQGLTHRDVKPANILLTSDGTAKLIDFGMALLSDDEPGQGILGRHVVVGTKGYMAPEQAEDSASADFRADIYSLGVTLHEAVTGRRSDSRRKAEPMETAAASPRRFLELVHWMKEPLPHMRPPSYDALIDALEGVLHDISSGGSAEAVPTEHTAARQ